MPKPNHIGVCRGVGRNEGRYVITAEYVDGYRVLACFATVDEAQAALAKVKRAFARGREDSATPAYEIKPEAGTPLHWVWKDGVKHRDFTSRTGAQAYLDHVLKHGEQSALRAAAPALAELLREQGIIK
jgi:hypothetical protein